MKQTYIKWNDEKWSKTVHDSRYMMEVMGNAKKYPATARKWKWHEVRQNGQILFKTIDIALEMMQNAQKWSRNAMKQVRNEIWHGVKQCKTTKTSRAIDVILEMARNAKNWSRNNNWSNAKWCQYCNYHQIVNKVDISKQCRQWLTTSHTWT